MLNKIKRIKNIVSIMNQYRESYYNNNTSEISDAEYDKLFDELFRLDRA